jgi:hypothetical protein
MWFVQSSSRQRQDFLRLHWLAMDLLLLIVEAAVIAWTADLK